MFRISGTLRIALGLAVLSGTVLLASRAVGLGHHQWRVQSAARVKLCELVAIHCCESVRHREFIKLGKTLDLLIQRNPDIRSITVCSGNDVVHVGEASNQLGQDNSELNVTVPLLVGSTARGTVQLRFKPLVRSGIAGLMDDPASWQMLFVVVVSLLAFTFYLHKMLIQLDPSRVIPDRVRKALDALAEGLLVMDKDERIVLANQSFSSIVGAPVTKLQGQIASEFHWTLEDSESELPWVRTLEDGDTRTGQMIGLMTGQQRRTFLVNASPILSDEGQREGVLASFDDVTEEERRKSDLRKSLAMLADSREKIRRQNEKLKILATCDPLTGCKNRRSFFEDYESAWDDAGQKNLPLSCVMLDVDHFKSVNDNHGHSKGDEVLKDVAAAVREAARPEDLVCRYGGEEFCVVMPGLNVSAAWKRADEIRQAIVSALPGGLNVTASLGVSSNELGATEPQGALDEADKSLYVAKRQGRNQVVRWDDVPDVAEFENETDGRANPSDVEAAIPFHAVTALISALSYRDQETAEHSRRVADLCVNVASRILNVRDTYTVEMAALLHDIGKIGVPDSVLLKQGSLTKDEWKVMSIHDEIGVDILNSTFACDKLTEIVATHHSWYGGREGSDLPSGEDIPIGARILAIADAYDAIVSDRVYRKGRSPEAAFEELRRCAGKQFDPNIVELFIQSAPERLQRQDRLSVEKQTALRIGLQIEKLTDALDKQEIGELHELAQNLKATGAESKIPELVEAASELEQVAQGDPEADQLIEITAQLLDLCRSTQKAYLENTFYGRPKLPFESEGQ